VSDALKLQIDELRKELESSAVAAKKKLDGELSKLTAKFEKMIADGNSESTDLLMNAEMKAKEEVSERAEMKIEMKRKETK
tara:strand:- start:336 stop:578 length:243 start_codon:yes stop_codon:yes gene_type:complete